MVPNGWEHLAIDQILTIGSGKDYKHLSSGNIPVYGSGGHMLNVSEYLYDGDSVCIGRKGTIDKPMFLSGKFWTVDTLFFTHSFKKTIPQYVYQYFLTINWRKYSEASGVPSLSKAIIQNIKLNLPPLSEQRKIANILGTWDKAINTTERLIDNSKKQKKAVMQQLLTGKKRLFDDSGKPFEGKWEEVKLKSIAEIKRGAGSQYITYVENSDEGIRLIRISDFLGDSLKYIKHTKDINRFILQKGDLLIAGTGATAGIVFEVPNTLSGLAFSYNAPRIRVDEKTSKKFIYYYLKSQSILSQQLSLFTGNAQPFLDTRAIGGFRVKLPSIKEQNKIASVLSNADKEIVLLEQQLADLKQEKKALMQQLLTGKRRVLI